MGNVHAFHHCVIGVARTGTPFLLEGPSQLCRRVGGPFLQDSSQGDRFRSMPDRPGLSRATIECRWEREIASHVSGDGHHARVFFAREVEEIGFCDLALDRYGRAVVPFRVFGALAAGLSRALHRRQTRVHQQSSQQPPRAGHEAVEGSPLT